MTKHASFGKESVMGGNDGVSFNLDSRSSSNGSRNGGPAAFNITIDETKVDFDDDQQNTSEKLQMFGMLYAMLVTLIGLLFAVTEALSDMWLKRPIIAAYLVYIYSVSIAFIIYFQAYLLRWKPPKPVVVPNMNRRKSLAIQRTADGFVVTEEDLPPPDSVPSLSAGVDTGRRDSASTVGGVSFEEERTQYVDLSTVGNIFEHSGSSFYLRLGVAIFAIGHLIYIGLEIYYFLQPGLPSTCREVQGWTFWFRLAFVIVQTFFLFKNPSIHIHKQFGLAHFGFQHLIATNVSVWIRTLAQEILDEFVYVQGYYEYYANRTMNGYENGQDYDTADSEVGHVNWAIDAMTAAEECSPYRELLGTLTHYLFPFVLEYSLIALGMLIIMNGEIGHEENPQEDILKSLKNLMKVHILEDDIDDIPKHSHGVDMDKAHLGMFGALMVITGVLVAIILFFYFYLSNGGSIFTLADEAIYTYQVTDLIIHVLLTIFCIVALVKWSKLSYIAKPMSVDDGLMVISMAGAFLYEMCLLVSAIGKYSWYSKPEDEREPSLPWSKPEEEPPAYLPLMMACSSLAAIQTVLQVVVVTAGLRRYSSKREHLIEKPGRSSVIFLVLVNAIVWFYRTMLTKNVHKVRHMEFFGIVPWLILQNSTLPLLLFYRFHSSVCLQDAYIMAYEPITSKIDHVHHAEGAKHVSAAVPTNINIPDPVLRRINTNQKLSPNNDLSKSGSSTGLMRRSGSSSSVNMYVPGGKQGEDNPLFTAAM